MAVVVPPQIGEVVAELAIQRPDMASDDAQLSHCDPGHFETASAAEQPSMSSEDFVNLGRDIKIYSCDGLVTRTRAKLRLDLPAEEVPFC